ncbi:hypothetical protein quinque_003190 [Culex quinquefasciatus]
MRRSVKMIWSRVGVLAILLILLETIVCDQTPCDHRIKLSNCRNNELNYEVEMDGPFGDKYIVEQKVRRVPNERTLASRMNGQRTQFRDWVGSVFPTWRPGPLRQFMNGGRQRSSRTAPGTSRRARANRLRRPRQGRTGSRRAARRNQRL